jgi:hypothetical protein
MKRREISSGYEDGAEQNHWIEHGRVTSVANADELGRPRRSVASIDENMRTRSNLPASLKIVAWFFILSGWCAVIEIVVALLHSRISFNFGVLGIFIGRGLLQLRPGWRTWAVVLTWLGLLMVPVLALLAISGSGVPRITIFGIVVGRTSHEVVLLGSGIGLVFFIWQLRALTRADVRRLFTEGVQPSHEPNAGLRPRRPY